MSTPAVVPFSRFQAIVNARPLHNVAPQIIFQPTVAYEHWGEVRDNSGKRRKEATDVGGTSTKKVAKRSVDDEGSSSREPLILYRNIEELLSALKNSFGQSSDVDFHGMYTLLDPGVTHKERIQTVANDIWKTTGYRFTVKDHPMYINGHKTRFWCSQDEAHRSKSSRAARRAQGPDYKPRVTSQGETMAKTRYPCKSRLLISSRDSQIPGTRAITVRMHHHLAHPTYTDATTTSSTSNSIITNTGDIMVTLPPRAIPEEVEEGSSSDADADAVSVGDSFDPHDEDRRPELRPQTTLNVDHAAALDERYHSRMTTHIKNLREFCDGLEYQLQFNDFRMLEVLEREGGSFLNLVADCLRKEGRLVPTDPPATSQANVQSLSSPSVPAAAVAQTQRYDVSQGINPRALEY